jgi:hypothetical protein
MRPLNLGETLDASIKIVRARWKTLAMVMVVIALPLEIANVLIISSTTDVYQAGTTFSATETTKTTHSDDGAYFAGQVAILSLTFLSYLLGTVACYRAVSDTYLNRETNARASLSYAANRLGATLWLAIVFVAGILVGFLAFVIPGVYLAIAWSVAFPVMLVEGLGGFAALKRSFELTRHRWWATLGRLVVAYILVTVVSTVAIAVFLIPANLLVDDTSTGALIFERAGSFVVSLVTTPFIAAVTTLVYFDLRVRKEGFDLAVLAERTGGAPAAGPAPAPATAPQPPRTGERDAFGNPIAPPAYGSAPPAAPAPAPGSWAPPVAPEPQRPPSPDE